MIIHDPLHAPRKHPKLATLVLLATTATFGTAAWAHDSAKQPAQTPTPSLPGITKRAYDLTQKALLVDGHNDLPWALVQAEADSLQTVDLNNLDPKTYHTDFTRLRHGGVGLQYWSAYVPAELEQSGDALAQTMNQIDLVHRMAAAYPQHMTMVYSAAEARAAFRQGKIASMIGVEGGYSIQGSLANLRLFHKLGVRYMTLTHSRATKWADSATDKPVHNGLTAFGRLVVTEMNRIGMQIDLSHVSTDVMRQTLALTQAPVIFSHSSAFHKAQHPRNVPDDILRLVAKNRGVVMVNFFSAYTEPSAVNYYDAYKEQKAKYLAKGLVDAALDQEMAQWREQNPMPRGSVATVVDHIEYISRIAGIDHVGLGSDFDGVPVLPVGLDDVSGFPRITAELLKRGFEEEAILKILGENAMRVLSEVEAVAKRLQTTAQSGTSGNTSPI